MKLFPVKKSFSIILLIVFVVLLRIILLTQPSFKIDMGDWQAWAARLVAIGPFNFYSANFFADYFPFFYLCLFVLAKIFAFIFGNGAIFSIKFEIYIKVISNIFDLLTAIIIYRIVNKHSKNWAFLGSLLYLLNPSVIFNSSVWGQVDAIPTFLIVLSLYQLEEKKKIVKSLAVSVLSFLIKPLNVSLFPIMIAKIIRSFSVSKILKAIGLSLLVFIVVTVPFFLNDPIIGPLKHLFGSLNVYPYTSINAYNFWGLFGWWKPDSMVWLNLSLHVWGYILFAVAISVVLIPYLGKKMKNGIKLDYLAFTLSSFGFFLFLTRMHERHLFPVFALLIISACIFRSRVLILSYTALAVINFLNLFYSYYYYNVVFNNSTGPKNIIFEISSNYQFLFSTLSLLIFVIVLIIYFVKARASSVIKPLT